MAATLNKTVPRETKIPRGCHGSERENRRGPPTASSSFEYPPSWTQTLRWWIRSGGMFSFFFETDEDTWIDIEPSHRW